jgi:hypothetical protein
MAKRVPLGVIGVIITVQLPPHPFHALRGAGAGRRQRGVLKPMRRLQ